MRILKSDISIQISEHANGGKHFCLFDIKYKTNQLKGTKDNREYAVNNNKYCESAQSTQNRHKAKQNLQYRYRIFDLCLKLDICGQNCVIKQFCVFLYSKTIYLCKYGTDTKDELPQNTVEKKEFCQREQLRTQTSKIFIR